MTADRNPIEDAVEQALDAFVYAPIGLLFDGPARFPKLVRNGKSQVNNARMLGPFAVRQARAEVEKRTADLDGPVVDLLRGLGVVPGPPPAAPPTPTRTADVREPEAPAAEPVVAEAVKATPAPRKAARKPAAKKAATKPATKKPTTKKAQAATSTAAAGPARDAEANREAAKQAAEARTAAADAATPSADVLPIPDYDSLSASQVVTRLRGLSTGQLDAIRAYETATRGRKTILNRVQQLSKP